MSSLVEVIQQEAGLLPSVTKIRPADTFRSTLASAQFAFAIFIVHWILVEWPDQYFCLMLLGIVILVLILGIRSWLTGNEEEEEEHEKKSQMNGHWRRLVLFLFDNLMAIFGDTIVLLALSVLSAAVDLNPWTIWGTVIVLVFVVFLVGILLSTPMVRTLFIRVKLPALATRK